MKLGIAHHLRSDLSARFLWWDPDMVPVAPVELFDIASGQPILAIGGKRIRAYRKAFGRLSGGSALAAAPDGSSFVTHAMVGALRLCTGTDPDRIAAKPARTSPLRFYQHALKNLSNTLCNTSPILCPSNPFLCPSAACGAVDRGVLQKMLLAFNSSSDGHSSGATATGTLRSSAGGVKGAGMSRREALSRPFGAERAPQRDNRGTRSSPEGRDRHGRASTGGTGWGGEEGAAEERGSSGERPAWPWRILESLDEQHPELARARLGRPP